MAAQADGIIESQKKAAVLDEMQLLKERIDNEGANIVVQQLVLLLKLSKAVATQRSELDSQCNLQHSRLLTQITIVEEKGLGDSDDKDLSDFLDHFVCDSLENLNSVKKELAHKLREIVSLKRRLDELPVQAELIQYERRFSELYAHIQEKLRRTRKYYDTYNALLEIKDLMTKETSLLNSISSQFQDAISSSDGCMKLIDSMETILKGTQQKLAKVQISLQGEQIALDALRERYAAAIADQRRCSSLLKAFQEECARNEKLRSQTSYAQQSQHIES